MEQQHNEEFSKKLPGPKLFTFFQQQFSTLREEQFRRTSKYLTPEDFLECIPLSVKLQEVVFL